MRSVGIKLLKNRLSEYVKLAAAGETVLVTDRDRVVARLVPPEGSAVAQSPDEVLATLVARGLATPARHPAAPLPAPVPGATLAVLLEDLAASRDDR